MSNEGDLPSFFFQYLEYESHYTSCKKDFFLFCSLVDVKVFLKCFFVNFHIHELS